MAEKRANVCLSGGAPGADLAWGAAARRSGHAVMHFSFAGHRTRARRDERIVLSAAQLRTADRHLRRVARILGRRFVADGSYRAKLLRRDWYQVRDSARLYAVASFDGCGQVAGGTGWTVALFLARRSEAYVYDQRHQRWLAWSAAKAAWRPIVQPPPPRGRWTGIGTRRLTRAGRQAIDDLLAPH